MESPFSYYSDCHSIFKTTRDDWVDGFIQDTQFQRALKTLGIMPICANSPQAKGRVERANKTLQDRLIKELRLKNISSMEEENAYLPTFIEIFNQKFSVVPKIKEDAHIKNALTDDALQNVLSIHETRTLSKNLEFSYESTCYQITTPNVKNRLQHKKITLIHRNDGNIKIFYNEKELSYKFMKRAEKSNVVDFKCINAVVDELCTQQKASAL
ncbi:MAG: ISNCY family transposase ISEsa1 [Holosporales bacterium]